MSKEILSTLNKLPAVYKINIGKYFYIGSTGNLLERITNHLSTLRRGVHRNSNLQDKYSDASDLGLSYEYFDVGISKEDLEAHEQKLIREQVNNPYLLNWSVDNNPWVLKSLEVIENRRERYRKPVMVDGILYNGIDIAMKELGLTRGAMVKRIGSPYFPRYYLADDKLAASMEQKFQTMTPEQQELMFEILRIEGRHRTNKASCKVRQISVTIDQISYESIAMASEKLNLSSPLIRQRIKSSKFPNYHLTNDKGGEQLAALWFEKSQEERDEFENNRLSLQQNSKGISINNQTFPSAAQAGKHVGLTSTTVLKRARSDKYPEYKLL